METTIQISQQLLDNLRMMKMGRESYEEVIWDLIEDTKELSEETKRNLDISRKEAKEGKVKTLAQVKKELGF